MLIACKYEEIWAPQVVFSLVCNHCVENLFMLFSCGCFWPQLSGMKASFSLILLCFKSDFGLNVGYGMCMLMTLSACQTMLMQESRYLSWRKQFWGSWSGTQQFLCHMFFTFDLSKLLFHQIKRYYVYCILQTEPLSTSFEKSKHKLIALFFFFFPGLVM